MSYGFEALGKPSEAFDHDCFNEGFATPKKRINGGGCGARGGGDFAHREGVGALLRDDLRRNLEQSSSDRFIMDSWSSHFLSL